MPVTGRPRPTLHRLRLVVGTLAAGIAALSVHVLLMQFAGVPFPGAEVHAPVAQFVNRGLLHALGVVILYHLASTRLCHLPFWKQCGVLFLASAMLTEYLFRLPFMDGYCSDAIAHAFAAYLPRLLSALGLAVGVIACRRWLPRIWQQLAGATALALLQAWVLAPVLSRWLAPVVDSPLWPPGANWCELPYGWKVEVPAYFSFAEPAVGAVWVAGLVWNRLSPRPGWRLFQFTLLVTAIRRQLLAAPIYSLASDAPPWTALASMGQFTLECWALAVFSGLAWQWAKAPGLARAPVQPVLD